jgi:hypothetical protein
MKSILKSITKITEKEKEKNWLKIQKKEKYLASDQT